MRASLKPQVRGTLYHSTGTHRNHNVRVMPEIESENWHREVAEQGRIPASDRSEREFESFRRMMQGNRGVL